MDLEGIMLIEISQRKTNTIDLTYMWYQKNKQGFPGGAVVESLPANAGDAG